MFAEKVLVEHAGGDELGVGARVQVHGGLHLLEGVEDVLGTADVAEAEAGGEHLGHRAEAQRALGCEGSQGDRRTLCVVELAVGIVLDEPEVVLTGLFGELAAAFLADRAAGRVLVGGHHVGKLGARDAVVDQVGVEALIVGRQADELRLAELECIESAHVGRRFDEDLVTLVGEDAGDHVEGLLGAGDDHDFVGRRGHAVVGLDFGDGFEKCGHAAHGGVLQSHLRTRLQNPIGRILDGFDREAFGGGKAAGEADHFRTGGEGEDLADHRAFLGLADLAVGGRRGLVACAALCHDAFPVFN